MLHIDLDKQTGIAILSPDGALSEDDFVAASGIVDPYIEETGQLNGLIVHTESFPGWESFGAFLKHLRFVKEHHKLLSHVALVTDSAIGNLGEKIASHFVSAEIKHFKYSELEQAKSWIAPPAST